jgi:hypothetical protein
VFLVFSFRHQHYDDFAHSSFIRRRATSNGRSHRQFGKSNSRVGAARRSEKVMQTKVWDCSRVVSSWVSLNSTMEKFHSTIAVVEDTFPVAEYLTAVNAQIRDWTKGKGPIVVSVFESIIPPYAFKASHNKK